MTDIKETIQGLFYLKTYLASMAIEEHGPARESLIGMQKVVDSAVNLLKEQETKNILGIADSVVDGADVGRCPMCQKLIVSHKKEPTRFCRYCGQAVKFDG